MEKLQNRYTVL